MAAPALLAAAALLAFASLALAFAVEDLRRRLAAASVACAAAAAGVIGAGAADLAWPLFAASVALIGLGAPLLAWIERAYGASAMSEIAAADQAEE